MKLPDDFNQPFDKCFFEEALPDKDRFFTKTACGFIGNFGRFHTLLLSQGFGTAPSS